MIERRNDSSLLKILAVLFLLALGAAGAFYGLRWYRQTTLTQAIQVSAPQDVEAAERLAAEGKMDEARTLLASVAGQIKDQTLAPRALMLLAKLQRQSGETDQAVASLKRLLDEFPASPQRVLAEAAYARLQEEAGNWDEAVALYEKVRGSAPPELRAPALTGLGHYAEYQKKLIEASELYNQAVRDAEWNSDAWNEAADALGRANVSLVFSPAATPASKVYVVEQGDSLVSIGVKLNTTQGMLTRANGLDENTSLSVGQRLKYTPKDFRIVIERSTCRLFLFDKDGLFKRYRTGLGMPGHETSLGSFKIGNKQKDPAWFKPGEGHIPPGDPRNELGTRWMPLIPIEEGLPKDLGIHGTVKPETVGTYSSRGCARLLKEEVEELFDLVVRSTPVDIVDAFHPEKAP